MTTPRPPEDISDDDLNDVQGAGTAVGNPGKAAGRKIILAEEMETILMEKSRRISAQNGDGGI